MRIGIDIRNIGKKRTGDEVVFFNLVKNLALIDSQNEYLLLTDVTDADILKNIASRLGVENKSNFKIISFNCPNKFIWNFWTLPDYLRKNPVDIYHTQYIAPFFVPKNIKIVTHIHDVSFNAYPELISKLDIFFLKILIPRSLKRADLIIAVSEFTKQEIEKYYRISPDKIKVVYNAVPDNFEKGTGDLEEIRKKYSLPKKFILYVGTLQPRKNIPMLIEAFAQMKNKVQGLKLVIVGNKKAHNFDKKIEKAIESKNLQHDVIFPGYIEQEDISAVYSLAEVFVFPSLYEGFGIPLLEAMRLKIPVLASDIPVHREVAGEGALFFDLGNLEDLSEKLYNAIDDKNLREKIISSSRSSFFSWKKSAEQLLEIYNKII